jgi:signal transduction histidine kinase
VSLGIAAACLVALAFARAGPLRSAALVAGLVACAGAALLAIAGERRGRFARVAERRLRESQGIARIGSWEHDVARGTFAWSGEMFRIFGRDPQRPVPPLEERLAQVHPQDRDRVAAVIQDALRLGRIEPFEYRITHGDGETRVIHVEGQVLERDAQGRPRRVAGTCQDVTERRRIEDDARRLETRLLELRRLEAIGTLAGGIAHDFNNILMAILGNTQLALAKIPPHTPGRENLDPVLQSSLRAKALVAQVLDFSRAEPVRLERVDVAGVVRDAVQYLRPRLPADVQLVAAIPADPVHALADAARLHQVVVTLGTNALDAMRPAGGELEISVIPLEPDATLRAQHPGLAPGRCVQIVVADTGHGIPDDVRERIFDPFFTTRPVGEGVGMGLAAAWGIVADHGGAIEVDSAAGRGSRFRVLLPCGAAPSQPVGSAEAA